MTLLPSRVYLRMKAEWRHMHIRKLGYRRIRVVVLPRWISPKKTWLQLFLTSTNGTNQRVPEMSRAGQSFSGQPVTICPTGQKSDTLALRVKGGGELLITTATSMKWPASSSSVPSAQDDRRSADERIEAAKRADAMSVVLAQPHRNGSDDPRLAFPLGQFCARVWRNDPERANAMYAAGGSYANDIRALKIEEGFHVPGSEAENMGFGGEGDEDLTPEGIADKRAKIFGLRRSLANADAVLRDIMPRLVAAMERLCFDHIEPSPYDEGILTSGLYRLACHYGHFDPNKFRA